MATKTIVSGIYKITCLVNGNFYIGSSNNTKKRWIGHLSLLRRGIHYARYLQRSFTKYGESNFIFEVLEEVEVDDLFKVEQSYIDNLKPIFNQSPIAGGTRGYKFTDEQRLAQSIRIKAYYDNGGTPHNKGVPRTEEERKAHSEKLKGRTSTFKGKKHTEEAKQRMSESRTGMKMNDAHREAQSKRAKGESNVFAKLGEKEVLEIIQLLKQGETCNSISKKYNVTVSCVSMIKRGKTWTHLTNGEEVVQEIFYGLTIDEIHNLRKDRDNGLIYRELVEKYNLPNISTVKNICDKVGKWSRL